MTMRAIGPFNGTLPVPTGMIVDYLRQPSTLPFVRYTQLVAAPEVIFSYFRVDPDEHTRMPRVNDFVWGYDDYRPTGRAFTLRGEFIADRVKRYDFSYQIGETTRKVWKNNQNIDPKQLYDSVMASKAALHRATRVLAALTAADFATVGNTGTPQTLLGTASPVYFDESGGEQFLPSGDADPRFQVIKKTFQAVKQRINLATNGYCSGKGLVCVMGPSVAHAIASSGEMVNFLKQSVFADKLTDPNIENWNLPPRYAGFELVVEDTVKTLINQHEDGTVADVSVAAQKGYMLGDDTMYFLSRPEGLDGPFGGRNFSTVQCYHVGGEARVEAFSEPKHELVEGHIVMEDKVLVPATASGFRLSDVLST